jgi:hypothetical protein
MDAVVHRADDERGAMMLVVAMVLPLGLLIAALVFDVSNWHLHRTHLQTKVDAAAFAGGSAWGFPCGTDIDSEIETTARTYVGQHTKADGSPFSATTFNPQVGGTPGSQIHVVMNGLDWWDDDGGSTPADGTSPLTSSICASKTLDVKATEANVSPLFGWLPFYPDIKRKARVEIQEVEGLTGLLPIAVRTPQPLAAAAVFYNEGNDRILAVKYLRQVCTPSSPGCLFGVPPGLGQWTTEPAATDPDQSWADFNVAGATGVVIATSFRPACGTGTPPAGPPCLDNAGWTDRPIDDFCRQASGTVQCYDANGSGSTQTVASGLHFIRGFPTASVPPGPNLPELRGAWLENLSCPATGYFSADAASSCIVALNVTVDAGSCLRGPGECFDDPGITPSEETRMTSADPAKHNVQMRYCLVQAGQTGNVCDTQFNDSQDMNCAGGPGPVTCSTVAGTHPQIAPDSRGNAFAIEVRLRRTSVTEFPECQADGDFKDTCRFFFTGGGYFGDSVPPTAEQVLDAPVQRSFMGDLERTGPVKWLRLTVDQDCDPLTPTDRIVGDQAASQPFGCASYLVEMGMAGGLAQDQDEPPIAFNLGGTSSQRAYVDCDEDTANIKSEIVSGCQSPSYSANKFNTTPICPETNGFFTTVPKAAPFDKWPPFRCVLTQTGNSSQVIQGFNERIFGRPNNPSCPSENTSGYPPPPGSNATWTRGRNYWHRQNNLIDDYTFAWDGTGPPGPGGQPKGNTLRSDDPRLVSLFFTTYDSFGTTGNEVYAIVGFGNFYVTGYGETRNGSLLPEDPCGDGNDGDLYNGTGNEPPPDLNYSRNTRWVWGHFVKDVAPAPFSTGGSGVLCNPDASFQPCVAVLVE